MLVTSLVAAALNRQFSDIRVGGMPESLGLSITSARMAGANFVIYPKVLLWDDRVGTWGEIYRSLHSNGSEEIVQSFGLDRARLQIIIMDATNNIMVDLVEVEADSGLLSLYADQPGTLLIPALEDYFSKLALNTR